MAAPDFDSQLYFVRTSTEAGELISETEALVPVAGWELFEDMIHNSEDVVVELISQSGRTVVSNRVAV